jgi:hypothetical protein
LPTIADQGAGGILGPTSCEGMDDFLAVLGESETREERQKHGKSKEETTGEQIHRHVTTSIEITGAKQAELAVSSDRNLSF